MPDSSDFVTIARAEDVPEGGSAAFLYGQKMVAVFRVYGRLFAIDDFCPHMGAPLSGGHVEGHTVVCPWHAWCFDIRDGTWLDNPQSKIDAYDVRENDGKIQIRERQDPGTRL